ncbi:hypothetical protein DICVIV_09950, partial [Dictyocaulus viviparus]
SSFIQSQERIGLFFFGAIYLHYSDAPDDIRLISLFVVSLVCTILIIVDGILPLKAKFSKMFCKKKPMASPSSGVKASNPFLEKRCFRVVQSSFTIRMQVKFQKDSSVTLEMIHQFLDMIEVGASQFMA